MGGTDVMLGPKKRQKGESNKWKREKGPFFSILFIRLLGKTNDARDSYNV